MKIEKVGNRYRVRPYINGKRKILTFDHKPTEEEIQQEIELNSGGVVTAKFGVCCQKYIDIKENVLSPSTIAEYRRIINYISDYLLNKPTMKITQADVQAEINQYAVGRSPKTVRNFHGFIASVLSLYNPSLILRTTLPQKVKQRPYIPSKDEITAILDYCYDTKYWIPLKLACYGMRRGEILALTIDDIDFDNNKVQINKALVLNSNNEYVIKSTKTTDSTRTIYIDQELADRIKQQGYIYQGGAETINQYLIATQKKLGIQHFTLHKLRHYFASQLFDTGNYTQKDIEELGGWKSNSRILQDIYTHSMETEMKRKNVGNDLF